MERIERCVVQRKKRGLYYIRLTKNEKCEGCKACGFGKKNFLVVPALSDIPCNVGDEVTVAMPQSRVKGAYLYLYLLPLLFLFAGLMIPYGHGEGWMLLGGVIGLCAGIPVVYGIERLFRRRKKYLPVIKSVLSESGSDEEKR